MISKEILCKLKDIPIYEENNNQCSDLGNCCSYKGDLIEVYNDEIKAIEKDLDEFLEYKKLEEKVGLNLFIINKALTDGIWFKYDSSKPIIYVEPCDIYPTKGSYLRIFNSTILEFKDYGKTWALTKRELEK